MLDNKLAVLKAYLISFCQQIYSIYIGLIVQTSLRSLHDWYECCRTHIDTWFCLKCTIDEFGWKPWRWVMCDGFSTKLVLVRDGGFVIRIKQRLKWNCRNFRNIESIKTNEVFEIYRNFWQVSTKFVISVISTHK